jgi:hypothetical protein
MSIGAERVETGCPKDSWTDRCLAGSIGISGSGRSEPGPGDASRIVGEAAPRRRRVALVPPIVSDVRKHGVRRVTRGTVVIAQESTEAFATRDRRSRIGVVVDWRGDPANTKSKNCNGATDMRAILPCEAPGSAGSTREW